MISSQAASWRIAEPGARAPRSRYGWVTRATAASSAAAAAQTASRSGASTRPPAPCVTASRKAGRAGSSSSNRAGPLLVPISTRAA